MCVCIYVGIYICIYIYIYIYVYIYIYECMYIYIYIYILINRSIVFLTERVHTYRHPFTVAASGGLINIATTSPGQQWWVVPSRDYSHN